MRTVAQAFTPSAMAGAEQPAAICTGEALMRRVWAHLGLGRIAALQPAGSRHAALVELDPALVPLHTAGCTPSLLATQNDEVHASMAELDRQPTHEQLLVPCVFVGRESGADVCQLQLDERPSAAPRAFSLPFLKTVFRLQCLAGAPATDTPDLLAACRANAATIAECTEAVQMRFELQDDWERLDYACMAIFWLENKTNSIFARLLAAAPQDLSVSQLDSPPDLSQQVPCDRAHGERPADGAAARQCRPRRFAL